MPESFAALPISASLDNTRHDTAEAVIDNRVGKIYKIFSHDRTLPFQDVRGGYEWDRNR